jgi:hypothetical protein
MASSSTFYTSAGAEALPQTVRSTPSMPTIIRPGAGKKVEKVVKKVVSIEEFCVIDNFF